MGTGLVPDHEPMNPNAAVPRWLFQLTSCAVTAAPDWVTVAFHA